MNFLALVIIFLMFIFPNVLMFTSSLLSLSVLVLVYMTSVGLLSVIILLLVLIVYVGAVIILIGYVCAVSPNLYLTPRLSYSYTSPLFFTLPLFFSELLITENIKSTFLVDFFISPWGLSVFVFLIFSLFLTLLIVTSQFVSPIGPFRSIST